MILDNDAKIETIFQIGDIHIRRNNDRDDEYKHVFEKLYEHLKPSSSSIIIITGDVFNDGLSPTAIMLAKNLIIKLCTFCQVIVIRGFSDQSGKNNHNSINYLFPILYKLETKNKLFVLEKSGNYVCGNIMFSYTDLYNEQLTCQDQTDKLSIGLYHGNISDTLNDAQNCNFNVSDFKQYQYVLLGGNHQQKFLTDKIAYSGSLIQQNFDEPINSHGFIKWNLLTGKGDFISLKSDYGFATVTLKDNTTEKIVLPQNVNLKIIRNNCNQDFIDVTYEKISKRSNIISFEEYDETINASTSVQDNTTCQDLIIDECNITQENVIPTLMNYIKTKNDFSVDEQEYMKKKLTDLLKKIDYNFDKNKRNIKLKNITFDNFNVFGGKNYINYDQLKGIINVCGRNGVGKSSAVVDVLLCAIYGKKKDDDKLYECVNNHKNSMHMSIVLRVNDIEYMIERTAKFAGKKRSPLNFTHSVKLFKNGTDISCDDSTDTEKKIIETIGEKEELIKLCIMKQKNSISFLNLTDCEKKEYICNLLKLDIYTSIQDSLASDSRLLNSEIANRNQVIFGDKKNTSNDNTKQIEEKQKTLEVELNELLISSEDIIKKFNDINKVKIEKELKLSELDVNPSVKDVSEEYDELNKNLEQYITSKTDLENILNTKKERIKKYDNMKKKKKEFDENKENLIKNINDDIISLWKEYVKVEEHCDSLDELKLSRTELEQNILNTKEKMDELTLKITELKENTSSYLDSDYEQYMQFVQTLDEDKQSLGKVLSDIKKIETSNEDITNQKQNIEIIIKKIINTVLSENETHIRFNECKQIFSIIKKYEHNEKVLESIREYMKTIEDAETNDDSKIITVLNDYANFADDLRKYDILLKSRDTLKKKIKSNEKIIEKMRHFEEEHITYEKNMVKLDKLNEKLEKLKIELNEYNEKLHAIDEKIKDCNKNEKILQNNKKIKRKIKEKETELEKTKTETFEDYERYIKLKNGISKGELELSNVQLKIKELEINKITLSKEIEKNKNYMKNEKLYTQLTQELGEISDEYEKIEKMKENILMKKRDVENELNNIKLEMKIINNAKSEKEIFERERNIDINLVNVIKNGFIDDILTNIVLPNLCTKINNILSSFVNYKIHMVYDNKKIIVYKKDNENLLSSSSKLSGYETLMANIAFRLAINEYNLVTMTDFFIIDEGFAYCDEQSIAKITNLFNFMRKKYKYVIVISHNEQIKTYADVDVPILNKNGISNVVYGKK